MTKTYISKKVSNGRAIIDVYADKTSIEVCICSHWLQFFMHKFRDGLARSLKMEAIFLGFFFSCLVCVVAGCILGGKSALHDLLTEKTTTNYEFIHTEGHTKKSR